MLEKKLMGKIVKYLIIILILAAAGTGGYFTYKKFFSKAYTQANTREMTAKVTRGDLAVTISGTGTVQPVSRYDIVPLVKGNIISAPFEEGMEVKAGDLLYKIDDSDLSFNIEKSQNSIERLKLNNGSTIDDINNLVVTAPVDGRISNFTLKEGDQVNNNGKIADFSDYKHLTAIIPFNEAQAKRIKAGQKAQIMVGELLIYLEGTVKYINYTPKPSAAGSSMCDVEIAFDNPGALRENMEVSVTVKADEGDIVSTSTGKISFSNKKSVVSKSSGKVKQVFVKDDEWVTAGQKIIVLENDTLAVTSQKNSLDMRESELSLNAQKKQLDNYNILSPIDGKIIKKNYKAGDTIYNGNNSTTLMTVADMTKMVFTIDVDELDIAKIELGQKVSITADALPGTNFEGQVTSTSLEGKTSNGVTTYPVQATISNPGKLRPGMNVNAKIQVESKKNVLYVPMSAVTKVGNKAFVTIKSDGTGNTAVKENTAGQGNSASQQPQSGSASGQGDTQRRQAGNSQNSTQRRQGSDSQGSSQQRSTREASTGSGKAGAAGTGTEERQRKEVVVGINTDNFIEIVSGLNEGDTVYLPTVSTNSSTGNNNRMPNVIGGGMGFPGGGR